jgi:hypothetical protein
MKKDTLKNISKAMLTLAFLVLINTGARAQGSKPHFAISNPDKPADTQFYYDALKDFDFAKYRFYDKRRTIKFINSTVTLELYSEKELHDLYQKAIDPQTIMDNTAQTDIAFMVYGGKVQMVKVQK